MFFLSHPSKIVMLKHFYNALFYNHPDWLTMHIQYMQISHKVTKHDHMIKDKLEGLWFRLFFIHSSLCHGEVILRRYYYRIECWASSAPCHLVNGTAHCVLCEVYSGMGVVGTQQLTVNGDKALQTAVNTLTCCLSRSVHYVSHECLYDTMCVWLWTKNSF